MRMGYRRRSSGPRKAQAGSVTQLDGSPLVYGKSEILNPHFVARAG